jgi:hypothetical protein
LEAFLRSIKLHSAKHLRLAWDTSAESPPCTRTGIMTFKEYGIH